MNFGSHPGSRMVLATVLLALGGAIASPAALAQHAHDHGARGPARGGPQWHGDIARFHEHDWGVWRGGRWIHDRHDGRIGWWWVAGGLWYFYPSPVYPYPNPWEPAPAVIVTPPQGIAPPVPPTQYWYYCEAARAYYPYVPSCPGGWKPVPASPDAAAPAQPR